MLIKAYGLFWLADEVDSFHWERGRQELLGRLGQQGESFRVADFWKQSGVYVLYSDHGPYYVGLVRQQSLGTRLRAHIEDRHRQKWDRFSWFGFREVLNSRDQRGLSPLKQLPQRSGGSAGVEIGDMEALLITALGTAETGNKQKMRFAAADEWRQIKLDEVEKYQLPPGRYRAGRSRRGVIVRGSNRSHS
jgi:hypothetical protein